MSFPPSSRRLFPAHAMCGLLSVVVTTAAEQTRSYDLPRGDAATMLARFAKQSGRSLLFAMDKVRGIRTNAVVGDFSPAVALERMLSGTDLVATLDPATGDIVVSRRSTPTKPKEREASLPQAAPTEPAPATKSMPLSSPLRRAAAWLALLVSGTATDAQTGSAPPKDDTVVLSPFTVSSDRDVGFVAATSLAGGRMTTDLKDTPLAYSVLTTEFIEALNLVDTESAMEWSGNSSVVRDDGADRINNGDGGSRTRVRGVPTKSLRNFFELGRFGDTYNQGRIDFARGANALLIGNAGLGGATIMMTKQPGFGRRAGEVAFTTGSYGSKRATLDLNQPFGEKFALRADFLRQDANSWREKVFDRRRGIYLTAAYRPGKQTQLRVDFERYRQEELVALSHLNDRVSGWDGVTVFNAPTATLAGANALGVERTGNALNEYNIIIAGLGSANLVNYANTWRTLGGGVTSTTKVNGVTPVNFNNLGAGGSYVIDVPNEPANRYSIATAHSKFFVPTRKTVPLPNNLPTFGQVLENVSAFLDHQASEHFFFQAAFSHTRSGRITNTLTTRLPDVYIDINRNLPTGGPNPYFLEPYVEAARDERLYSMDRFAEGRAAVAYVRDRTRFGSFRFNVLAGHTIRRTDLRLYTHAIARNPDRRLRPNNDAVGYRFYLNDPNQSYSPSSQVTYINPATGVASTYPVEEYLGISLSDSNNRSAKRNFDYVQTSVFGKFFKDRVTVLAGARRDHFTNETFNNRPNAITSYPADWDGKTFLSNPEAPANYFDLTAAEKAAYNAPKVDQRVTTVTYGTVVHATSWLSGFYNFAQTYDTSLAVQALNGDLLDPLVSEGWDAGIRLNLMHGRLNVSLSTYGTVQNNAVIAGPTFLRTIGESNVAGDLSATGRNQRGLPGIAATWDDYQDNNATGYEFEAVGNITKNWRVTYNLAFPETKNSHRYSDTWAYLNEHEATLRQIVIDSGATIDANNVATNRRPASEAIDASAAATAWNALQTFKLTQSPSLQVVNSNYKFTTNLYTDYRFSEGKLQGLRIGGGVQYRSKRQIGNRASDTIVNPANQLTAIDDPTVDGNTLVYMDPWYMVTATLAYEMKLKRMGTLSFGLNVSNLLARNDPIFFATSVRPRNGDILNPSRVTAGGPFYYPEPRRFSLSTRLKF